MSLAEITLNPLGSISLKPPQPFTAGTHGPGAMGSSLSYPMPSTIAGIVASLGYKQSKGECIENSDDKEVYGDTVSCISSVLGEEFQLYTGFLRPFNIEENRFYVYFNTGKFPAIKCLLKPEVAKGILHKKIKPSRLSGVEALRHVYTGISLDREKKTVREGLIYNLEYIIYKPRSAIVSIAIANGVKKTISSRVKLGSKTSVAELRLEYKDNSAYTVKELPSDRHLLITISPALLNLDDNPFGEGTIMLSDESVAEKLGSKLLETAGIKAKARLAYVQKGEHELGVQTMGWSFALKKPRKPLLVIPPGSIIEVYDTESDLEVLSMNGLMLTSIGRFNKLGWGTSIVVTLDGGSKDE